MWDDLYQALPCTATFDVHSLFGFFLLCALCFQRFYLSFHFANPGMTGKHCKRLVVIARVTSLRSWRKFFLARTMVHKRSKTWKVSETPELGVSWKDWLTRDFCTCSVSCTGSVHWNIYIYICIISIYTHIIIIYSHNLHVRTYCTYMCMSCSSDHKRL